MDWEFLIWKVIPYMETVVVVMTSSRSGCWTPQSYGFSSSNRHPKPNLVTDQLLYARIETYHFTVPLQFNLQPNRGWEGCSNIHMWQSRVEIEDYSVAYFDRIAVLNLR